MSTNFFTQVQRIASLSHRYSCCMTGRFLSTNLLPGVGISEQALSWDSLQSPLANSLTEPRWSANRPKPVAKAVRGSEGGWAPTNLPGTVKDLRTGQAGSLSGRHGNNEGSLQ